MSKPDFRPCPTCGVVSRMNDDDNIDARITPSDELVNQLVEACQAASDAHTAAFVHGQPLQWATGERFDHTLLNEMAWKCEAAIRAAKVRP